MPALRVSTIALLLVTALVGVGRADAADDWDAASHSDDTSGTDNTLVHGAVQEHDLHTGAVPGTDEDWYQVQGHSMSSYEILVDSQSGGPNLTAEDVQRITGTQLAGGGAPAQVVEGVLSLTWLEPQMSLPSRNLIQVTGAACAPNCQASDRYRIRFYDTTYTIPRYNNTNGQSTVVLIRTTAHRFCTAQLFFLGGGNVVLVNLFPGVMTVIPPTMFSFPSAGSIRIAHTCGYGGLAGKAVSIEPATGFVFDTEMVPRPY